MFKTGVLLFLLFIALVTSAQEPVETPPLDSEGNSKWTSDGFSYADFGTQEQHSYFSVLYKLNPKLHAELQGFYDTYRTADVFDVSVRMKWYPTENVYLFSGLGMQIVQSKGFGEAPSIPTRAFNGIGYEPNGNMTIEAVHDLNFDKNGTGLNATPSLLSLKGKYRF